VCTTDTGLRMMEADITFRDRPGGPIEMWGVSMGTREKIESLARDLLRELRLDWRSAKVWVGDKPIHLRKKDSE
jgi:hypothetical protein